MMVKSIFSTTFALTFRKRNNDGSKEHVAGKGLCR